MLYYYRYSHNIIRLPSTSPTDRGSDEMIVCVCGPDKCTMEETRSFQAAFLYVQSATIMKSHRCFPLFSMSGSSSSEFHRRRVVLIRLRSASGIFSCIFSSANRKTSSSPSVMRTSPAPRSLASSDVNPMPAPNSITREPSSFDLPRTFSKYHPALKKKRSQMIHKEI